jgi:hypothetical protein
VKASGDRTGIGHTDHDFLDVFGQASGQFNVDMAADF